ncbi:WD40 repeat-like protein [Perkinsela sp. CCAP 1560/4]|nr:WD40 repeat-like protein [Perkinsela sp. CCAP 1560/4]|eukprot:KNH05304.1 WD40 repeat-like protein [Perkinsela sp. CCAP 1560/4]
MKFSRNIDLDHQAPVHDCQVDYYGKLLASCSSDGTVKVKSLSQNEASTIAEMKGHDGQVWALDWAHPAFGTILASGSFDSTILVWAELEKRFEIVHQSKIHSSSVNSLSWAPKALGLRLISASSDGNLGESLYDGRSWKDIILDAKHSMGCLCVQWYPSTVNYNGSTWGVIGSGGCDAKVKLWLYSAQRSECYNLLTLACHDWIRDIAFDHVRGGSNKITVAAAVQDKKIVVAEIEVSEIEKHLKSSEYQIKYEKHLISLKEIPWKFSWSQHASILNIVCKGSVYSYDVMSRDIKRIQDMEKSFPQ